MNRLHRHTNAGFSLVELLLVMLIMGIVLGMGVGAFASLDVDGRQDVHRVRGVLRTAAGAARAREAAAVVELDARTGTMVPRVAEVIGTWDFEEDGFEGAFGLGGFGVKTRFVPGRLGDALELPVGAEARAELAIGGGAEFDVSEGFVISCALRPSSARSAHAVNVGNSCGVYVLSNGGVRVWFAPLAGDGGSSPHVVLDSPPDLLPLGRWTRVRGEYDRARLTLRVDGRVVAEAEHGARVAPAAGALALGGGRRPYEGAIDELVVGTWIVGDAVRLSESASFGAGVPARVAFDAAGRLDGRIHEGVHGGGVIVPLETADGGQAEVRVGAFGVVE